MTPTDKQKPAARLRRPKFQKRQLLTAEQLQNSQHFHEESLRRALHALAGEGVVYGYKVSVDPVGEQHCVDQINIGCGLALDHYGRQLYWNREFISMAELGGIPEKAGEYTLYVHYAERHLTDSEVGECDEKVQWIEEGVVFTLKAECEELGPPCPALEDPCIGREGYICRHIDTTDCLEAPANLCAIGDDDWWYDPKHGIPLACVKICPAGEECEPPFGFLANGLSTCEVRRSVYRNPLLYELIQPCHIELTRVESLDLPEQWPTNCLDIPIPWSEFAKLLEEDGIKIWFTKLVRRKTLHRASVFLNAIVREQESYFQDVLRVPIHDMLWLEETGDWVRGVHLKFDEPKFIGRQIKDVEMSRCRSGTIIELTVRTSLLRDECGYMLDGRPLDIQTNDPAQSMAGVDFVAPLYIEPIPSDGPAGLSATDEIQSQK